MCDVWRIGVCNRLHPDVHNGVVGIPAVGHRSPSYTRLLLPAFTMSSALQSPFRVDCLRGKVALVTGGGSGICFQIARQIGEVRIVATSKYLTLYFEGNRMY